MSKKRKGMTTKAKKKEAKARAVISKNGKGIIRINHRNLITIPNPYMRALIMEPIELAAPAANDLDIDVTVNGGGFVGQMIAARGAIAKGIIEVTHDEKLKKKFLAYDRMLLVDDARRVEPKKQLGPKARSKKQKSKR